MLFRSGTSRRRAEPSCALGPFERPLERVAETVDFLRPALAGERAPNGFKLEAAPPPMREKNNAGAMRHATAKPKERNEGSQSGGALAAALAEAMKRR